MAQSRVRRSPDEARAVILAAAEELLIESGPAAVQVRAVASRVGMTDAGVTHHFTSRDGLLVALLRHGGSKIRTAVTDATSEWINDGARVADLVERIAAVYRDGYGQLVIALSAAGWSDDDVGLLNPVVDALHAARRRRTGRRISQTDTRLAVAALHQALATESAYGAAFRRSAGLYENARQTEQQRRWWVHTLVTTLDIDESPRNDAR